VSLKQDQNEIWCIFPHASRGLFACLSFYVILWRDIKTVQEQETLERQQHGGQLCIKPFIRPLRPLNLR